jgi:GT2 family glycosyltransferase
MELSIIIVSWNVRDYVIRCLSSIFAHPPACTFEVWVVDNVSTDGTPEQVRSEFPHVHLINSQTNVGFAGGNNQAIRQSTGRYVLLLNPDTEVRPGALTALVEYLEAHPRTGAVGPRLLNPDGSLQVSCFPFPTLGRELWRLFHLDALRPVSQYAMHQWPLSAPRAVDVIQGACLALRRETLDQTGLLDEAYFIYTEEVDLCYRIQRAGWSLFCLPYAEVVHHGGQSTQQAATRMFLNLYKSKLQYFRKHRGAGAARLYKLILLTAALARLGLTAFTWLEAAPRRERHLKLAGNYVHLLKALPAW